MPDRAVTIVVANKAYSSWSMRGWLAVRIAGVAYEEVVIPLREANTRMEILKYSPSAKLPALVDGEVTVWESLAIIEYLADKHPHAPMWPKDLAARAHARAIAAEMHGGFVPLRRNLPMNLRRKIPAPFLDDPVQTDINRIQAIWRDARRRFGSALGVGPFLFGGFSAADAMFAPVATRFDTYGIALEAQASAYVAAIMAQPFVAEWIAAAQQEPWMIPEFEPEGRAES
jgi:glutathione S-transferase